MVQTCMKTFSYSLPFTVYCNVWHFKFSYYGVLLSKYQFGEYRRIESNITALNSMKFKKQFDNYSPFRWQSKVEIWDWDIWTPWVRMLWEYTVAIFVLKYIDVYTQVSIVMYSTIQQIICSDLNIIWTPYTLRKKGSSMVLQNGQKFYLEPFAIWTRLKDVQTILRCEEPLKVLHFLVKNL